MKNLVSTFAFGLTLLTLQSIALAGQCQDLFEEARAAKEPRLYQPMAHAVKLPARDLQPLVNTKSLIMNVVNGGAPRAGVPLIWSSPAVLQQILSLNGPLASLGPLSRATGLIGRNWWQPSFWNDAVFDRVAWKNQKLVDLYAPYGPLGQLGPLGPRGPLGEWSEGPYNILGTGGALGPLGPLGPIGPMGAPQWKGLVGPDKNGEYRDRATDKIIDTVVIDTAEGQRRFPIFEYYHEAYAQKLSREEFLDTSFMTDGYLRTNQVKSEFRAEAEADSVVTVQVLADYLATVTNFGVPTAHNFDLVVRDLNGREIISSKEVGNVNIVQFFARKGQKFVIAIERQNILPLAQNYRLMVVGDQHPQRLLGVGLDQFPLAQ